MRKSFLAITLACFVVFAGGLWRTSSVVSAQTPPELQPNDQGADITQLRFMNLPAGWFLEQGMTPLAPEVVLVFADGFVNSSHPDLQGLIVGTADFTSDPQYDNGRLEPTQWVAPGIARTNNSIAISGVGGLSGRVKAIIAKIVNSQGNTSWAQIRQSFQHAIEQKDAGKNVVAVAIATYGVDPQPNLTEPLLTALEQRGIALVTFAGNGSQNVDGNLPCPACYKATHKNIIVVTGSDGDNLALGANWGMRDVDFAAQSVNLPTISPLNPNGSTRSTSPHLALPQIAVAYALLRLYGTNDAKLSLSVLRLTAKMPTGLREKVLYGRPDMYAALNYFQSTAPWLSMEQNSAQPGLLASVEAFTLVRDPFPIVQSPCWHSLDCHTRILLFGTHLELQAGEDISVVQVELVDNVDAGALGGVYQVPVEDISPVPDTPGFSQVRIRLVDGLPPRTLSVRFRLRGAG